MTTKSHVDRPLVLILLILIAGGALVFASAAFGLLARGSLNISSVALNHLVLGIGLGLVALIACSSIDYKKWRPLAPYLFGLALIATALVFIPQIGAEHGGGRRWLYVAGVSFQPAEALKLATVLIAAAYFATFRRNLSSASYSMGGFLGILALPAVLLVLQPDLGTLGIISAGVLAVYLASGAKWRHITAILLIAAALLGAFIAAKPYARERMMTFFNPSQNQQREGYQIRQSLIAIGSGEFFGRGFGQGVQKFTYLPEPMGDSIFAVAAEELGFVGATTLVILFLLFGLRGFAIAAKTPDAFGALLAIGISAYLVFEAFVNMAAMLGLAPLTGIPLTFISQGGSAMLLSLIAAGILLNISRKTA